MSIRPYREILKRKSKEINVGNVKVGGSNPISVQSMTNTLTTDISATIKQVEELVNEELTLLEYLVLTRTRLKLLRNLQTFKGSNHC